MRKWVLIISILNSFFTFSQSLEDSINKFFVAVNQGDFNEALKYENTMIANFKPYSDTNYIDILTIIHFANQKTGRIEKAFLQAKENYVLSKKILTERDSRYLRSIKVYADILKINMDYLSSSELYKEYVKGLVKSNSEVTTELILGRSNIAFTTYKSGDIDQGQLLYEENLDLIEKNLGKQNIYYADDIYILAGIYKDKSLFDESIVAFETAKQIYKRVDGSNYDNYAHCIWQQAEVLSKQDSKVNKIRGLKYFNQLDELKNKGWNNASLILTSDVSLGSCLYDLNLIYRKENKPDSAEYYLNQAHITFKRINSLCSTISASNNISCETGLSYLAMIESVKKNHDLSINYYEELIRKKHTQTDNYSADLIYYESQLGNEYLLVGNKKKGSKILTQVENKLSQIITGDPSRGLTVISSLQALYRKNGDFDKQIMLESLYLETAKKIYKGENNEYCLLAHTLLGQLYDEIQNADSVFYHFQKSKEISIILYGKRSEKYIERLFEQMMYTSSYANTEINEKRLIELFNELDALETEGLLPVEIVNDILRYKQSFYQTKGDLSKVLSLQRNESSVNYAQSSKADITLRIMEAENLSILGKYVEAQQITHELFLQFPQMNEGNLMKLLRCAAMLPFMSSRDIEESYRLLTWSIELHKNEKKWKENNVYVKHYITQVSALNKILVKMDRVNEAITNSNHIIQLGKSYFGENDNSVYTTYYELGFYHLINDEPKEAIEFLEIAKQLDEKLNNTSDPLYISSFNFLGECNVALQRYDAADSLFTSFIEKSMDEFKKEINLLSERDFPYRKLNLVRDVLRLLNYAVFRAEENPKLLEFTINTWFYLNDLKLRKGRLYTEQSKSAGLFEEYTIALSSVSRAVQIPPNVRKSENIFLEDLLMKQRRVESLIGEKTDLFDFNYSIEFIRSKLKSDENYVFMIPYRHVAIDNISSGGLRKELGDPSYFVGSINSEKRKIEFVVLDDANLLKNDALSDYEYYIKNPENPINEDFSSYNYYFKPIEKFFKGSKTYFCPADVYLEVNLEGVYHPEKRKLLIDIYNFQYVDPLNTNFNESNEVRIENAALFGGINYGSGSIKAKNENDFNRLNSIVGIRAVGYKANNSLIISSLTKGFPAEQAGLKEFDEIIEIDGLPIDLNKYDEIFYLEKIRGIENSQVELKVKRGPNNQVFTVNLRRVPAYTAQAVETFNYLPGTLDEINSLYQILNKEGKNIEQFQGVNASENNLKKLENIDLLHIATHAFYVDPYNPRAGTFAGILDQDLSISPFLLNGLLMAGVNDFYYPEMELNKENGFVNGLELSLLKLEGTDLVVISGCESGMGAYGIGEGVHGFKEALMRAGAKNIILATFKIDDQATRDFFVEFYSRLTSNEGNIEDIFRDTKRYMQSKYKHPYYWSAFQLYSR